MHIFAVSLTLLITQPTSSVIASPVPLDDTLLGKKVSSTAAPGTFYLFDKNRADRVILRVQDVDYPMIYADTEMECFVANHLKDDYRVWFDIYQKELPDGSKQRNYVVTRIRSEKSGDDTKTWAQKEQSDPDRLKRDHEQLAKVRHELRDRN